MMRSQRLPALWKELAKEIQGDSTLLKGFLAQAASLQSITDHRTQELAFESVFRMWKVSAHCLRPGLVGIDPLEMLHML